jgi:sugar phosphate isomerase/epimerase
MASAGFAATEFWPKDLYEDPGGPDIALEALKKSGLAVSCYQALRDYEGMPADEMPGRLDGARQLMDQMQVVGAELLVMCCNTSPRASGDRQRTVDDLRKLGELAASRGVRVAYEVLGWGTWLRDYREAARLIEEVDHQSIGLNIDSAHIFSQDLPLEGIDAIPASRIFLVELADLPRARLEPRELTRHYRLFPGQGVHPVADFIRRIGATGYSGYYSVEIFNDHYAAMAPDAVAKIAMESMRTYF